MIRYGFLNILRVFTLLLPLLCCLLSYSLGKYLPILFFLMSISLLFIFVMLWIELRASHITEVSFTPALSLSIKTFLPCLKTSHKMDTQFFENIHVYVCAGAL